MNRKKTTMIGPVLAVCLMAASLTGLAQHAAVNRQQSPHPDEVINLESTLITVPVIVSDRDGRYVSGLRRDDFLLTEDGVEQSITQFSNDEEPMSVAILMDTSSSDADRVPEMKEAALSFVNQLRPQDRAMVVSFNDQVYVESELTADRTALARALRLLQTGTRTQLYEAIYLTAKERLQSVNGRKAILLLSDGLDTDSPATQDELLRYIEESGIFLYAVHFDPRRPYRLAVDSSGDSCSIFGPRPMRLPNYAYQEPVVPPERGKEFLQQVAEITGGRFYRAKQVDSQRESTTVMGQIAEELRHQYVLGYHPTNDRSDGTFRRLRVRVPNREALAVRARSGYRALLQGANDVAQTMNQRGR